MPIYLDHHATTPTDPRVLSVMTPYFSECFGNPAGQTHGYGRQANDAVETAREQVGAFLHGQRQDIIFTSGATESNNLALLGLARRWTHRFGTNKKPVIFCSDAEHPSIEHPAQQLENEGFVVEHIPLDVHAEIDIDALTQRLRERAEQTMVVCLQLANGETGTIYPVEAVGALCAELGIAFHVDATQAPLWVPINVETFRATTLALSAHKMHGPKGVGILYIRHDGNDCVLTPEALFSGGGQEFGMRPGTQNVPGIVGMGEACRLAEMEREADCTRIGALRNHLLQGLTELFPDAQVHGSMAHRLPNNLNIGFPCLPQLPHPFAYYLTEVAVSATSACCSSRHNASKLLGKIGVPQALARNSLRIGLGRFTTNEEIEHSIKVIAADLTKFRHRML